MSFANLEERFYQNVNKLYAGATTKFAEGKPTSNITDEPYIVDYPGQDRGLKYDSRMFPEVSTLYDLVRLTLFQRSFKGAHFILMQRILQTSNVFAFTRQLNKNFVLENAVPFRNDGSGNHVKRSTRPTEFPGALGWITGVTGRPISRKQFLEAGQLQNETYDKVLGNFNFLQALISSRLEGIEVSALLAPRSVGVNKQWKISRPELVLKNSPRNNNVYNWRMRINRGSQSWQSDSFAYYINENRNKPDLMLTNIIPVSLYFGTSGTNNIPRSLVTSNPAGYSVSSYKTDEQLLNRQRPKIRYLFDPSQDLKNVFATGKPAGAKIPKAYERLSVIPKGKTSRFADPIVVSMAMGSDNHVQFRAYIIDLEQTVTPRYKDYQYIGRIEKFITYAGVQREFTFKLHILAFSKDELTSVWRRINYITGLTFPYGFNKGILQPNVARLTIGNVLVDQPGYFDSVNINFKDITESWEIDNGKQVPIGATMTMKFMVIEKATRVANSPFYNITEEDKDAFEKYLTPPGNQTIPKSSSTTAPAQTVQAEGQSAKEQAEEGSTSGNNGSVDVNNNPNSSGGTTTGTAGGTQVGTDGPKDPNTFTQRRRESTPKSENPFADRYNTTYDPNNPFGLPRNPLPPPPRPGQSFNIPNTNPNVIRRG